MLKRTALSRLFGLAANSAWHAVLCCQKPRRHLRAHCVLGMFCIRVNYALTNLCCSLGLLLELKLFLHYGVVVLEARRMETNTQASRKQPPRGLEQKERLELYARVRWPLQVARASPLQL